MKKSQIENLSIGLAYPLEAKDEKRLLSQAKKLRPKGRHEILRLKPEDPLPPRCQIYFAEDGVPPGLGEHPALVWIQACSAGADAFQALPNVRSGRAVLATASGIHSVHIAEFVLAAMIELSRRTDRFWKFSSEKIWPPGRVSLAGLPLRGRTVAILGYGSIGREIGRMAHALGMKIVAINTRGKRCRDDGYHCAPGIGDPEGRLPKAWFSSLELPKAVADADFLAISCPLTEKTRGIVNPSVFAAMKPTACVVNVGRGAVIDFTALREALTLKKIAAAALDVHPAEPLEPEDPVYDLPNVQITPHMSGVMSDEMYSALLCDVYIENLSRFVAGKDLFNHVKPG